MLYDKWIELRNAGPALDNMPVCPCCGAANEYAPAELTCAGCGEKFWWMVYPGNGRWYPVVRKKMMAGRLARATI